MCDNNFNKKPVSVGECVPFFQADTYDTASGQFGKFSLKQTVEKQKWTVLFFYPADFTFVCPTELADIAKHYDKLKKSGVELVSVSTDTQFVHLAWKEREQLLANVKYPMAADPTGEISRLFGVYDESAGLALRGTFIINPEGKLVSSEVNFYNVGRCAEELVRKIEANIYVNEHPEEVCPANWEAGKKTLKPSESMVGNVSKSV